MNKENVIWKPQPKQVAFMQRPEFETTFILKKNGQTREFTLDNYPDSTWEFVDSKTVQTRQGYEPPIHDFSLTDTETGDGNGSWYPIQRVFNFGVNIVF